jgi:ligand-binding sensor domain-containing protein
MMKKNCSQVYFFISLIIVLFGNACNETDKKELPKEKAHPKLIKTIGDPKYGNVQCSIQDKEGNCWFGTTENGLYKYDGKSFSRFLVGNGLNSNNISCILEAKDGTIWIGTDAGLCMYDGKTIVKTQIPLSKKIPKNKNEYYSNSHWIFNIMQAKNGNLWFATIDGVYIYDGKSFTQFIINDAAGGYMSTNNNVEYILEDTAGNIWFGGRVNEGVYRYDGKSITNFKLEELFQNGLKPKAHTWAWPQLQDKNGNIWFTNWGGAYRYDGSRANHPCINNTCKHNLKIQQHLKEHKEEIAKSFTSFTQKENGFTRIIEDKNGNLWFGGDGLSRYDGKSFIRFTIKDGLPNLGVWSILEDTSGNMWVGTRETGLYLFDGKSFITYSDYKQQP